MFVYKILKLQEQTRSIETHIVQMKSERRTTILSLANELKLPINLPGDSSTEHDVDEEEANAVLPTILSQTDERLSSLAKQRDQSSRIVWDLQRKLLFLQKMKERLQASIADAHSRKDEFEQTAAS